LDHFARADKINTTNKLDMDLLASLGAKWAVFVPDVLFSLQLRERGLIRSDVFKQADLPELEADDAVEGIVEQIEQKGIHVDNPATVGVEDQDAVLGRFE